MTPAITIVLDDRRKRLGLWWQKLQHAVGGVPLLIAGVARLQSPGGGADVLALAEIVVAAVLLVLLARDLRSEVISMRGRDASATVHAHAGPDWFDILAGALLIIESAHSVHPGGKPFYERPAFTLGIATIVIGLLHAKSTHISWKRREIQLDANGVRARTSRFRSFTVPSADVCELRVTDKAIVIDTATGSHTIPLRRYRNAGEIRAAFLQWDATRALRGTPPGAG